MIDAIIVLNAGSSSLKFSLFAAQGDDLECVARGQIEGLSTKPHFVAKNAAGKTASEKSWEAGTALGHEGALAHIVDWLKTSYGTTYRLAAVGHRVVHGGMDYAAPVRVEAATVANLEKLVPLAPLHQPHNLAPIRSLLERQPELPQVACFDTAAHRSNPPLAQMFALPQELTDAGVRRYGFHGLSYEYIASALPQFDEQAARGKTIVLHLGNGASMCALAAGRSIASTMGFTALDGLPMGTRCGSLDPGVLLYLMDERKMDVRAIEKLLYSKSGLLGVSGLSSDMRMLLGSDQPQARLAVDLYVYRINRELGSLAAALGGLDAVVFTAGIGEHAALIREKICRQAEWLGVELDVAANAKNGPRISSAASRVAAWVIPTNEELMIARHTRDVLSAA
ncbi:MAG TPA: acetate/propionate family kinase [Burkholderiales bacterium]|nr:acetate/propionate family kinase [Burkholderiales bacterium]